MSISLSQSQSNKAFGSDISDAMKQIIGKVGKKKNINGSVAMALEEQSYLVQLMLETKRDTGGVELCQTVLENFRRTLRSYTTQMEQVMGMSNVKASDERFMVLMTKQRTLEIEIRHLESKIDLMQRRNRVFDEFAERLSTLYSTGWPRVPSVPPQNVFEKNIEEIYRELHRSEMALERYIFLYTILSQGLKALDAAESLMNRFQNAQDMNLLKSTRLCTIQADVLIKQAKFVLPSLLNNQLNVVIFQDPQMINFLSAQHAALVPFIDEANHLVESQTETVKRLREKYHNAILDKENAQRKVLYDTIKGESSEGIQEILSLTYDMLSDLDDVIAYRSKNSDNDDNNNNNNAMASVPSNENNMEAFSINDDTDSQANLIGGPKEISRTPSIDSANTGTRAEFVGSDRIVLPKPSLEEDSTSLFLRPELNSGSRSRSPSSNFNLNRYNTSPSRSPSPSSMSSQREGTTAMLQQPSTSAPRGRTSPAPPRPRRAPTLDIDDVYGGVTMASVQPLQPLRQRVLSSTDRLQISQQQQQQSLRPPAHSPSASVSDTSSQSNQVDSRRNDFFRSTAGRSPPGNNSSNRGPSPLPSPTNPGYPQQPSRPPPPYHSSPLNDTNNNNRGPSPQPPPQSPPTLGGNSGGHALRPSISQQSSSNASRTLPVPRQLQRTLPIPPSSRSPVPSPTSYSSPQPQPQPQPRPPPQPPLAQSQSVQSTQPDARLSQSQQSVLSSAPPTLGGSASYRVPPPPMPASVPAPSSPSSPPPLPPKPTRIDIPDGQQPSQPAPAQGHSHSLDTTMAQSPLSSPSSRQPSPKLLHSSPTTTSVPTTTKAQPPHSIMKRPTTTVKPAPAKQPSMEEWGGVKAGAATAPKTKFRAIFDKLRGESGSFKRNAPTEAWHHATTSVTAASTSTSVSTPIPPQPVRLKPQFVERVEYIPRPEIDSYPLSDDEEEIEQPPSPSKRRNSLLSLPNEDGDVDVDEGGEEGGDVDLDDYYSNDYGQSQGQTLIDNGSDNKIPPHPGFPSLRESVTTSPSATQRLYMDEMLNPVITSQDKNGRPPPLAQPKPRTANTSNPLLSRNWVSPTLISRDLTFS
ncbi:hypothetical protein Clacol_000999 [Clathrus columnatus]|uniref:Uncharacterized protein n=1 Tax=Clathrus columnatus TaxID=1419009 RepID=A0AAV5A0R3_9AGAM|nr:hypothetical protein Clacol_000999 [Clathrus columnatus]